MMQSKDVGSELWNVTVVIYIKGYSNGGFAAITAHTIDGFTSEQTAEDYAAQMRKTGNSNNERYVNTVVFKK